MPFQLETISEIYGTRKYLAHNLKGQTANDDRALFGMRVPSYGIFDFGTLANNASKKVVLSSIGITSPILIRSVYAFSSNTNADEIKFRILSGSVQLTELTIPSSDMPYKFPDGAIIDPSLSIEIRVNQTTTQLLVYWQPVHVLQYNLIN